jgi:hypothetical protein
VILVVVLVVVALVGRSSHSPGFSNGKAVPGPSTASTPNGYKAFVDQTDHFSIAVPAPWRDVDPSSPGAAAAFQQIEQDNPRLKAGLGSSFATLMSRGVKFFAVEPYSQADVASNVTVIVQPAPGIQDSDISQAADLVASEAAKVGATVLGSNVMTYEGHQALQVSLSATVKDPLGNNITYRATQYYLGANDFAYIITLTGTSPDLATIATTFRTQYIDCPRAAGTGTATRPSPKQWDGWDRRTSRVARELAQIGSAGQRANVGILRCHQNAP